MRWFLCWLPSLFFVAWLSPVFGASAGERREPVSFALDSEPTTGLMPRAAMAGAAKVWDFGAVSDGVVDATAYINAALAAHYYVYLPPGTYRISAPGIVFTRARQVLVGAGLSTALAYTGTGTAVDFDGHPGCAVENILLYSTGGAVGIDVGPDNGRTRFPHWWRLERVMVVGDTPNWQSTALGANQRGWSTAGIQVESAFYGEASHCEVSWAVGTGFRLFNQANGNTFTGCHTRQCATGVAVLGVVTGLGGNSNGNSWMGGNIEAAQAAAIGIDLGEADRNLFAGRMEIAQGTHVRVNPPNGALAQENQFIGLSLTGPAAGYVLGDGVGTSEVRGVTVLGGKLGASVTVNSDCVSTRIDCSPSAASGVTVTDSGYGTIFHAGTGGAQWYERPSNVNTSSRDHDLLVGLGSAVESVGDNGKTLSFSGAPVLFSWKKVFASGVDLPVMLFGGFRLWVSPLDGKLYVNGADPTRHDDGTVVGSQL